MGDAPIRLNLGAGDKPLPGFTSIDRKTGGEVYPLDGYEDGSVEEIYASHVLEHFSHNGAVVTVLQHWVDKLKPGGRIRVAVPDVRWIAKQLVDGVPIQSQGYIMGGHTDKNDHHGCIFDHAALQELMVNCGLERVGLWKAVTDDCAALPVSLNMMGYKPISDIRKPEGVYACLSCPRFGPMSHAQCATTVFGALNIQCVMGQGAYWSHILSEIMERVIALEDCKYVLTCDYDTLFTKDDVRSLYHLAEALPEWDALIPLQMNRGDGSMLFGMSPEEVANRKTLYPADFAQHVLGVKTGHFGLTLFRADKLRALPRPWMPETPNADGRWGDGRVDADIGFWNHWKASGNTVGLANRVVVGHLVELVMWPDKNLDPVYQYAREWNDAGIPADVKR